MPGVGHKRSLLSIANCSILSSPKSGAGHAFLSLQDLAPVCTLHFNALRGVPTTAIAGEEVVADACANGFQRVGG